MELLMVTLLYVTKIRHGCDIPVLFISPEELAAWQI